MFNVGLYKNAAFGHTSHNLLSTFPVLRNCFPPSCSNNFFYWASYMLHCNFQEYRIMTDHAIKKADASSVVQLDHSINSSTRNYYDNVFNDGESKFDGSKLNLMDLL